MNQHKTDFESYKRELLVRSEGYRQSLRREIQDAGDSLAWVPTTLSTLRFASPLLLTLVPTAAFVVGRWAFGRAGATIADAPKRSTLFGKLLTAFRIYQQVKPLWDGYKRSRVP
jgi:hypothetical protein